MRWRYEELYDTPYLYSSKSLTDMYKKAADHTEKEVILQHLVNHDVHNDEEYPSYLELSKTIQRSLKRRKKA